MTCEKGDRGIVNVTLCDKVQDRVKNLKLKKGVVSCMDSETVGHFAAYLSC